MGEKRYIDLPKAVELVLGNIAERGADYRYTEDPWVVEYAASHDVRGCYNLMFDLIGPTDLHTNRINHRKGCLVGSAFVDFGIPIKEMVDKGAIGGSAGWTADALGIELSGAASDYLQHVQVLQDAGCEWGEAHAGSLSRTLSSRGNFTSEELEWLDVRQDEESIAS